MAHPRSVSIFGICMILLGITVNPVLLGSASLGSKMPMREAFLAILIGSAILASLSSITLSIGSRAKLNTYGLVKFPFGEQGSMLINLMLGLGKFGWLVVNTNMFAHAGLSLLAGFGWQIPFPVLVVISCSFSVLSTIFGIHVLSKITQVAVPAIMAAFFLFVGLSIVQVAPSEVGIAKISLGVATSSVVGAIIVLVTLCPDFGCRLVSYRQAVITALLTFALVYPILYLAGAMPSAMTGEGTLLLALAAFGFTIPAGLIILFATAIANTGCIFQVTLAATTLFPKVKQHYLVLIIALVTVVVSSFEITAIFFPFLVLLGIAIPPVAGIYIVDFLLYRQGGYTHSSLSQEPKIKNLAFLAWLLGAAVGGLTVSNYFTISNIPTIDAVFTASLSYGMLTVVVKRLEKALVVAKQ